MKSPINFEEITKEYFFSLGFENARVTQKSHDGGIDVFGSRILNGKKESFVAQCKRTDLVGVKTARELLGVLAANPQITKGYLVTSGEFSAECISFSNSVSKLSLINGMLFAKRLLELKLL